MDQFKAQVIKERGKRIDNLMHLQSSNLRRKSQHDSHDVQAQNQSQEVTEAQSPPPTTKSPPPSPPSAPQAPSSSEHLPTQTEPASQDANSNLTGDSIERILSRRKLYSKGGEIQYEYKVHWLGTTDSEDEWFLRSSLLADYRELVEAFDQKMNQKANRDKASFARSSFPKQDLKDSNSFKAHQSTKEDNSHRISENFVRKMQLQIIDLETENERLRRQLREVSEDRDSLRRSVEILAQHSGTVKSDLGLKRDETLALRRQNQLLRQGVVGSDRRDVLLQGGLVPSPQGNILVSSRANAEYTNSLLADAERRSAAAFYDNVWNSALRHDRHARAVRVDDPRSSR